MGGLELIFGKLAEIAVAILVGIGLSFAIPYTVLRLRDFRSEKPDPQIGLKAALYFFFSIGLMMFILGLNILVSDLLTREKIDENLPPPVRQIMRDEQGGWNRTQRQATAIMVSGLFFCLLHLALVKGMTNDRNPGPRRVFAGWRAVIHGLVIMFVVTQLLLIYFRKDFGGEGTLRERKNLWATVLVWAPSWILHLVLVWFYSRPLYEPSRSVDRPEWQR